MEFEESNVHLGQITITTALMLKTEDFAWASSFLYATVMLYGAW